jgi:F0F1-type ATP synthase membrane subunit a
MHITSPFEQFELTLLLPIRVLNKDISITNLTMYLIGIVVLITLFLAFSTTKINLIPGRWQNVVEQLYFCSINDY